MKFKPAVFSAAAVSALFLTGCCGNIFDSKFDVGAPAAEVEIAETKAKVTLDGVLDPKEWAAATVYPMVQAFNPVTEATTPPKYFRNIATAKNPVAPFQGGTVRFMYDDENLYIGAELNDVDIMQYGEEDQMAHFLKGDTLEIFLKPVNSPKYWECYGTPNGKKTSFFFETRGYPVNPELNVLMPGIRNAVKINGTLNNFNDLDKSWTIEIVIPRKQLAKTGCEFKPGEPWTILASRYNYTYNTKSTSAQHSTCPQLPVINYHHLEYYANVKWK